jgi:hypothetical protein
MPGKSKYKPVQCPAPGAKMCTSINEWAQYWYEWGLKVHAELFPEGEPDPFDPPPPPPFGE